MDTAITVRLSPTQLDGLRMLAARDNTTLAGVLRRLVRQELDGEGNKELVAVWQDYFGRA